MSTKRVQLPDFPWDALASYGVKARTHHDGIVDLSVGTPVDPVSEGIQAALSSVSELSGYPATHGTPALRDAAVGALVRRHGVTGLDPEAVLPTIGSKELVAWLPQLLGFGAGDVVVIPELAYPTYEVGALLAGATVVRSDVPFADVVEPHSTQPSMIWLNSPSNPTGRVLPLDQMRAVVAWARERDIVVVSDECYLGLGWETEPVSLLHPSVHAGRLEGLLAVHSLSKSANLAGYRAGFVTGDPRLVAGLLEVRKHAGMIVPRPVQEAMTAALGDDEALVLQRERYSARRSVLRKAIEDKGFSIEHSEAGLYLWATRGEECWSTVDWFAERGILVAPGIFYGPSGAQFVRIALTATDERIQAAAERLAAG